MSILKIIQYPDLRLRRKSIDVTDVKSVKTQKIIENMIETLINADNCGALAATQLDLKDPPSIIVISHAKNPNHDGILCLINPQIIAKEGSAINEEACMSIYPKEIYAKVKRAAKVKVKALNHNGDQIELDATDYFSRCIQHECDHLRGILYIDRLSKSERSRIDKKIANECQVPTIDND